MRRPGNVVQWDMETPPTVQSVPYRRFLPLVLLAAGLLAFFALGLDKYVGFDALREHRGRLMALIEARPVVTASAFVAVYALATAFSLPLGLVLTVSGGFLFGVALGTALVVIGATSGATLLFLAARSAVGEVLVRRAGPALDRVGREIRAGAFSYLLMLRLVPLFPFWLVNLAPALFGVSLRAFMLSTALGIIPGTLVYASFGRGLGSIFDRNEELSLRGVATPEIIAALCLLGLLSLVPVVYRRWRGRTA